MSFEDFSIFSSGGHFVKGSLTSCAILVEGIIGNIHVKLFQTWTDLWFRRCCSGLELRVSNENLIFLFLSQNICCGTQKNHLNGSFERPKHMLKLMGRKIFTILH